MLWQDQKQAALSLICNSSAWKEKGTIVLLRLFVRMYFYQYMCSHRLRDSSCFTHPIHIKPGIVTTVMCVGLRVLPNTADLHSMLCLNISCVDADTGLKLLLLCERATQLVCKRLMNYTQQTRSHCKRCRIKYETKNLDSFLMQQHFKNAEKHILFCVVFIQKLYLIIANCSHAVILR